MANNLTAERAQVDFSRLTVFSVERAKIELAKTDNSTATALAGVLFFDDFSSEQVSKDKGWDFNPTAEVDQTWAPNKYIIGIKKPGKTAMDTARLAPPKRFWRRG